MSDPEIKRILQSKLQDSSKQREEKTPSNPLTLSQSDFDKVVNGGQPVLVDFWADWCAPCRMMHPIFEKLSAKYGDKMIFARLNVDENSVTAQRFSVYTIPTFMLFMGGKRVDEVIGAVGESGLEKMIFKHLGKPA